MVNFVNYSDAQWEKQITQSHGLDRRFTYHKYLQYSVTLALNDLVSLVDRLLNRISNQLSLRWSWWNKIVTAEGASLYLGALPLQRKLFGYTIRDDKEALVQSNIEAVLSVTEPFETSSKGFLTSPVTPQEWTARNVKQLQLSTPDFGTIEMDKIHEGVEFIHWNIRNKRSVYVHCKAGRGRSALITACYLIKYHQMSVEQALEQIQQHRPQAWLEEAKMKTAHAYASLFSKP